MPVRHLPPELLTEIFSNLTSSPSTLCRSLLVSRTFYKLVKPILYRHITIRTEKQCELLKRVRREDKRIVKQLTILGDPDAYMWWEEGLGAYHEDECKQGFDIVISVLSGKVLDISAIETLHINGIHEHIGDDGTRKDWTRFSSPKVASKLEELSISGHQGGGPIWEAYLRQRYVPKLRRLRFENNSRYEDKRDELEEDEEWPDTMPSQSEESQDIGRAVPYSQLEVLVAALPGDNENHPILNFPSDNWLCLPGYEDVRHPFHGLEYPAKHHDIGGERSETSKFRAWVDKIEREYTSKSGVDAEVHYWLSSRPVGLSEEEYDEAVARIRKKGVVVHVRAEETDSTSPTAIPPAFVKYLEQKGQLKRPENESREKAGREWENTMARYDLEEDSFYPWAYYF